MSTSQASVPQVCNAAILSAFHASAILSLSVPAHSKVVSTTVQFTKSGGVVSSSVNIAWRVTLLSQSSVAV